MNPIGNRPILRRHGGKLFEHQIHISEWYDADGVAYLDELNISRNDYTCNAYDNLYDLWTFKDPTLALMFKLRFGGEP